MEEVQMLPAPGQTIVDGLIHRATGRAWQSVGLTLGGKVDGALGGAEVEAGDGPRCGQAECLSEELFHPPRLHSEAGSGKTRVPHWTRWGPESF